MRALLVATLALTIGASAARAQDSTVAAAPAKGELAGKWTSSNMSGGANFVKYVILDLNQRGDSLWGLASVERDGMPTETNIEIAGSFRGGKLDLHDSFGNLRMNGTMRRQDMRLRVVPGRYQEAAAYEMVFRRTQ